jgi:pilus assembly protein CpaE
MTREAAWPWRLGVLTDSLELGEALAEALAESDAAAEFQMAASAPLYEVAGAVERQRPDVIFVELAVVQGQAAEWIETIRAGGETPLVVAVHKDAEAGVMIAALRAGASEFLSMPPGPGLVEAMERISAQLEARQTATAPPGKLVGVLSAKGGCGTTTLACHMGVALQKASGGGKVLVLDLDHQSPSVHRIYRLPAGAGVAGACHAVRRLNSACWSEFALPVTNGVDMLAGTLSGPPEPWRVESLFRFVRRHYEWNLADLGRQLTPANWPFLPHVDELLIVTAPDVLALYQTRSVLQTLTNRGFERSKIRLILNRTQNSPQDFWIESIEQMFDMGVTAVLPYDPSTLNKMSRETFEFPENSAYGRAVSKAAGKIMKYGGADGAAAARPAGRNAT